MLIRLGHMVPDTYVQNWLKKISLPTALYVICPRDSPVISVRKCPQTGHMINLQKLAYQNLSLAVWIMTNALHLHLELLPLLKILFLLLTMVMIIPYTHMNRSLPEPVIICRIANFDTAMALKRCRKNSPQQDTIAEFPMVGLVRKQPLQ